MSITVVVADDEALIRAGLAMLLDASPDLEVVGEAADGAEAIRVARALRPDVVVMDVRMPVLDGVAATRELVADSSARQDDGRLTKILILTTFNQDDAVLGALAAGASGFLLKHAAPQDLAAAVRRVAAGEAWLDPSVAGTVIAALAAGLVQAPSSRPTPHDLAARLTPREIEVLTLMAHGLSNAEIRDRLVVAEATVKTHVARIIMKTGSRDRAGAVVLAYRSGLVRAPGSTRAEDDRAARPGRTGGVDGH